MGESNQRLSATLTGLRWPDEAEIIETTEEM